MIMRRLLIAILIFSGPAAVAWGGFEHSVIAYIAQGYLTENAEKNIKAYLDQPI